MFLSSILKHKYYKKFNQSNQIEFFRPSSSQNHGNWGRWNVSRHQDAATETVYFNLPSHVIKCWLDYSAYTKWEPMKWLPHIFAIKFFRWHVENLKLFYSVSEVCWKLHRDFLVKLLSHWRERIIITNRF